MLLQQHQVLSTMPEEFHGFNRLPAEIRAMIWEYSLPEPRVYEVLDAPNAKHKTPPQRGLMFANVHREPPPALAAVCQGSRRLVLGRYKPLTLGRTTKYVDLARDVLLLEPYLLVKRLHRALHFMSQIPLVRDSLRRLALGTSYGVHTGITHPTLGWRVLKDSMRRLLSRLAEFPRLAELVFVVHQDFHYDLDLRRPHPPALPHHHHPVAAAAAGTLRGPPGPPGPPPLLSSLPAPAPPPPPPSHRPQLVHQAYRFGFDIEASINHRLRRPHLNELRYYPLEERGRYDDDDDDDERWAAGDLLLLGGLGGEPPEEEEEETLPTNDDWRRFRRQFRRAVYSTLHQQQQQQHAAAAAGGLSPRFRAPAVKGARLIWRYTGGGDL